MKKHIIIVIIAILLVVFAFFLRFIILGGEDSWIKDSQGVWVKHGNPSSVPESVIEQQDAINCALDLYNANKELGMNFSSQCLGVCENYDYVVDIVHSPRTTEDNLEESQCVDFLHGEVTHFIELDLNGEIVRIA